MACLTLCSDIRSGKNPIIVGQTSAILYFLSVLFGLITAIPTGIILRNFDGICVLYAQLVWDNGYIYPWSDESCDFVLYFSISVCIFYAFFMGAFTLFAIQPRTHLKKQLVKTIQVRNSGFILESLNPVFVVINIILCVLTLISAITLTAGFTRWCEDLTDSLEEMGYSGEDTTCYKAPGVLDWSQISVIGGGKAPRGEHFYARISVAMIGAWCLFIIWFLQMLLNFRHCCRGFSCGVAEEKQRASKSTSIAMRRSQMASRIGTPGHMTPQMYAPPQGYGQHLAPPPQQGYGPPPGQYQVAYSQGHLGPNPQVSLGPLPPKQY